MRQHVGQDRAYSRKPLRAAREQQQLAEQALEQARQASTDLQRIAVEAQDTRAAANEARSRRDAAEAVIAADLAGRLEAQHSRAREYEEAFPEGAPLERVAEDRLAQRVAAALSDWERRTEPHLPAGQTADEIRREIELLPEMPRGDVAVASAVAEAADEYNRAVAAYEAITDGQGDEAIVLLEQALADAPGPPEGDLEPAPELEKLFGDAVAAEAQVVADAQ